MIRTLLLALLLTAPALAQDAPPAPPPPTKIYATKNVTITTALGPIVVALETERAPVSSAYFLKYVDRHLIDGSFFYRALKLVPDGSAGLVQGGVMDPKKLLPPVAHEPTSKTGLSHTDGAISLARAAPGTATANFFIIVGDLTSLDAQPPGVAGKGGDPDGYAVFGHVVEGMDVVKHIMDAPVSATKGAGAMKGQMIEAPVKIVSVKRG